MIKQFTILTVGAVVENHKGMQFTLRSIALQFEAYDGVEVMLAFHNPHSDLYRLVELSKFEQQIRNGIFRVVSEGK